MCEAYDVSVVGVCGLDIYTHIRVVYIYNQRKIRKTHIRKTSIREKSKRKTYI